MLKMMINWKLLDELNQSKNDTGSEILLNKNRYTSRGLSIEWVLSLMGLKITLILINREEKFTWKCVL